MILTTAEERDEYAEKYEVHYFSFEKLKETFPKKPLVIQIEPGLFAI